MQDQVNHTSSQSYVWFVLLNWEKRKAEQPITKKTTRWRKQTTVDEKKDDQYCLLIRLTDIGKYSIVDISINITNAIFR